MSRFFDIWNKSPIGWYEGLLVFEYDLASFSLDHDSGDGDGDDGDDADANGNANTDSGRRLLLLTSFFATNLPN